MAGPWFAVRELTPESDGAHAADWHPFGRVWISDGGTVDGAATLEMRERLLPNPASVQVASPPSIR